MNALSPLLLLWAAWYLVACWLVPFADCRHCQRHAHKPARKRPACRWCDNTGQRLRWGRRLIAEVRRARARANAGDRD